MGRAVRKLVALAVVLAVAFVVHCDRGESIQTDTTAVVDSELLAFLSLARAHHHEANLLEGSGDSAGAIAALRKIVDAPKPHPGQRFPEVEEVLADTYARMAELELESNDLGSAERDVDTGLTHATEPTYFRGHLLEVSGIIEEAHAAVLVDGGHTAEADKTRAHALALLREAVDVQEAVISRVLDARAPTTGLQDGGAR
jgi:hypothetical protein